MDKIGILHISDIHFCKENSEKIGYILNQLKSDVADVCKTEGAQIQAICITGDLINKGSEHISSFLDFERVFLLPLLSSLKLDFDSVFIVPGNHEIDTNKIEPYSEDGLMRQLNDSESIKKVIQDKPSIALERLNYFKEINNKFCHAPLIYEDAFCCCYQKEIAGIQFGFACLNSAWRSSGKGGEERGKMILGAYQAETAMQKLENTKVKICLMHHPLDWLLECDKYEVEKIVYKFDLLLNGHVHALDAKNIAAYQGKCAVSTSGRFYPSNDYYNGYSIITINPGTFQGKIILRQYYEGSRNCFDMCLNLYENGYFPFSIGQADSLTVKAFELALDLSPGFNEYASSFIIANVVEPAERKPFEEMFVAPPLGKWSEYNKETTQELKDYMSYNSEKEFYSLDYLASNKIKNLLFYGKKEYGKTTLTHYLTNLYLKQYSRYGLLPIIIDCSGEFHGKKSIERKCLAFLSEFGTGKLASSLDEIAELARQGKFIFCFDNFESAEVKTLSRLKDFFAKYPSNRFLFFALETVNIESVEHALDTLELEVEKVYIHSLGKHQIRNLASNMLPAELLTSNNIVDKACLCIRNINLPTTPFVVSLVLSICKENEDFVPVNEANVMENFIETLLDKNSIDSAKTSSFDYKIKEDFLCYVAREMHCSNQFWFSQQQFEQHLQEYHVRKGWTIHDTQFDKLFFEKGIFFSSGEKIAFRYACIAHYFLAKLALKSNDFLETILENDNYLLYPYELNYITGLERDRMDIYNKISTEFEQLIEKYHPFLNILNHYGIQTNFSLDTAKLEQTLSSRFSLEESDRLADRKKLSEIQDSSQLHKQTNSLTDIDSKEKFFATLLIYATLLKNSELYDVTIKKKMMCNMAKGLCIALAILIDVFNHKKPSILRDIQEGCSTAVSDKENCISEEKIARFMEDTVKIILPISIENIAFEQAGSAKLKSVILPIIQDEDENTGFSQFLMLFLYCDLRISGCLQELSNFVKRTKSKDLLTIALFKTMYYYKIQYFPKKDDQRLENIIADINIKLDNIDNRINGHIKGRIIHEIRNKRQLPIRDELKNN